MMNSKPMIVLDRCSPEYTLGLLLTVSDVSTTCAEVISRVKVSCIT